MKPTKSQIATMVATHAALFANAEVLSMQPTAPEPLNGMIVPGEIYLANEALFSEAHFNEPLTTYAVGWKDPNNIDATLEFFAPATPTPRNFTYASWTNIEEFLSEDKDDLRGIGADFMRVEYTQSKVSAKTLNRGLMMRVDLEQVADVAAGWEQRYVAKLLRRLRRNSLRRAIALISAAATNNAKTWDATAGKDPDNDLLADYITAATAGGIRPNRCGFGDTAWSKRVLSHRAQNNAGGYASAGLSPETLAMFLGLDQVLVSRERYSAAGAALAEVVSNLVLSFYAQSGSDIEDPSNIKRFVSTTDSGGPVRVYVQQINAKLVDIVVEHYELIKITSTLGIRKFTVS